MPLPIFLPRKIATDELLLTIVIFADEYHAGGQIPLNTAVAERERRHPLFKRPWSKEADSLKIPATIKCDLERLPSFASFRIAQQSNGRMIGGFVRPCPKVIRLPLVSVKFFKIANGNSRTVGELPAEIIQLNIKGSFTVEVEEQ